jgi:hypothetical protein
MTELQKVINELNEIIQKLERFGRDSLPERERIYDLIRKLEKL